MCRQAASVGERRRKSVLEKAKAMWRACGIRGFTDFILNADGHEL